MSSSDTRIIELLATLGFKPGDAVRHSSRGQGIIVGINLHNPNPIVWFDDQQKYPFPTKSNDSIFSAYHGIDQQGKFGGIVPKDLTLIASTEKSMKTLMKSQELYDENIAAAVRKIGSAGRGRHRNAPSDTGYMIGAIVHHHDHGYGKIVGHNGRGRLVIHFPGALVNARSKSMPLIHSYYDNLEKDKLFVFSWSEVSVRASGDRAKVIGGVLFSVGDRVVFREVDDKIVEYKITEFDYYGEPILIRSDLSLLTEFTFVETDIPQLVSINGIPNTRYVPLPITDEKIKAFEDEALKEVKVAEEKKDKNYSDTKPVARTISDSEIKDEAPVMTSITIGNLTFSLNDKVAFHSHAPWEMRRLEVPDIYTVNSFRPALNEMRMMRADGWYIVISPSNVKYVVSINDIPNPLYVGNVEVNKKIEAAPPVLNSVEISGITFKVGDEVTLLSGAKFIVKNVTEDRAELQNAGVIIRGNITEVRAINGKPPVPKPPMKFGLKIGDSVQLHDAMAYKVIGDSVGLPILNGNIKKCILEDAEIVRINGNALEGRLMGPGALEHNRKIINERSNLVQKMQKMNFGLKVGDKLTVRDTYGTYHYNVVGADADGYPLVENPSLLGSLLGELPFKNIQQLYSVNGKLTTYGESVDKAMAEKALDAQIANQIKESIDSQTIKNNKAIIDQYNKNKSGYKVGDIYNGVARPGMGIDPGRNRHFVVTGFDDEGYPNYQAQLITGLKHEATSAVYRVAANQSVSLTKNAIISLLEKGGQSNEHLENIGKLLDTEFGKALISMTMGAGLTAISTENHKFARFARECRVQSMTTLGNSIISTVLNSALDVVRSLPANEIEEVDDIVDEMEDTLVFQPMINTLPSERTLSN